MRGSIKLVAAVLSCVVATPALADDPQGWATLNITGGLGGQLRGQSETTLRTSEARGFYEIEQNLLLGYRLNKHVTLWAGYTFNPNYNHGSLTTTEHRAREQATFDNITKLGPVNVSARLRTEQRWRDNFNGTGWRVRPYVKFSLPVRGKTNLNLSHESFINLNTTAFQRQDGYERMRNAISISTPIAKHLTVEAGYLEQHGFVRGGPDTDDHAATVTLSAAF